MTQRVTKFGFQSLTAIEESIGKSVVQIAFSIHQSIGPGLLESVYSKCFEYELQKRNLTYSCQEKVPITYDKLYIESGLRLDLLIEDLVIVEIKAQENYHKVWEAQLLSYMMLANKRLGFLINFHVPLMKEGIKRMIR